MDLQAGETERFARRANHSRGRRAVGGTLHLTDRRLVFEPHAFDRSTGGGGVELALADVSATGVASRKDKMDLLERLIGGGLRDRLAVTVADGTEHRFVIADPASVAREIDAAR